MITYRGTAKDNYHANTYMVSPSIRATAPRDSKALLAKATAEFVALLKKTTPENGATAWLERSGGGRAPVTLVRYSGRSTQCNERGRSIRGEWFLEDDEPGHHFPERVLA